MTSPQTLATRVIVSVCVCVKGWERNFVCVCAVSCAPVCWLTVHVCTAQPGPSLRSCALASPRDNQQSTKIGIKANSNNNNNSNNRTNSNSKIEVQCVLWLIFIWHLVWVVAVAVALAIAFACAVAIVARTLAGNKTENEKSIALHLARSAATHAEPNLLCHLLLCRWLDAISFAIS